MDTLTISTEEPLAIVEASTMAMPATPACPTCGSSQKSLPVQSATSPRSFVYALGRIESRFPQVSIEKEFAQLLGAIDTKGKTDREAFYLVLSDKNNRYLVRQLCWVMTIADQETYMLVPRDPADLGLLIDCMRPGAHDNVLDAVIGFRGPLAPPDMCNGLTLPVVMFDQLYSFDRPSLLKRIPPPPKAGKEFEAIAGEVLDRILLSTDNAGNSDTHRALNYLALRDPGIYARAADCYNREMSLTAMEGRPWRLSASRKVVEVIFTFTHRRNEFVEKYATRVDVNDEFPFLVAKIASFFDH